MTLARLIASGFGSGLLGRAPGTAGSLAALVLAAGLIPLSPWALPAAIALACAAGWWAIPRASTDHDPGWIVIDEFAGQWIALLPLSLASLGPSPLGLLLAFALFRLFDIAKPGPIDAAQRLPGATGVMADDILAGLAAAAFVWAAHHWWPTWF
jgi:phosphatidylglycerophosphatase A